MSFTKYLTAFALFLATVSASEGVGKRGLFERQQTCSNPSFVPECPGFFACAPLGAICCDDNISYAIPPETCPDGTQPIKTIGSGSAPPSSITPAPSTSTQVVGTLTYFTYRITWYYYFYYFTYIGGASATTSSQVTTVTTVSVQATNTAAADAIFKSLSATIALPTPAQTATSFSGAVPSSTTPAPTTYSTPSPSKAPTNGTTTIAATTSPIQITGAGVSLRAGPVAYWAEIAVGVFIVPGLLMVML